MSDAAISVPNPPELPLTDALRQISIFSDLEESQLQWFAAHAEDLHLAPGDAVVREGDPADTLFVLLEGEVQGRSEAGGPDTPIYIVRAGQVTGMLPYSRMTHFTLTVRAVTPSRGARLHKDRFAEMLQYIPQLLPRLMGVMADRIRETSRSAQQREKLMALGKLSAGLAHELNNPAAAARRSAEGLRLAALALRRISARLNREDLSREQRLFLAEREEKAIDHLPSAAPLDPLAQSDLEEELNAWLDSVGVTDSWKLAGAFAEAGMTVKSLEPLGAHFTVPLLQDIVERFVYVLSAEKLTREIENATGRISELVAAIKEYSYMDQMPEQDIDLHAGIESTLTILNFRLKKGVKVVREFDRSLPRIKAHGSELNQVWTNLVDNAIDGMSGTGTLLIRTTRELEYARVEIIDDGAGIPQEVQFRIFEPFFTTKEVGAGTGLGLDAVYRIVQRHHGHVTFTSRPGETCFQVRLPFRQPGDKGSDRTASPKDPLIQT
ncbi:MAG TPA: ATP-binding protein [Bryobacteraceae bacterium]|nr:ATP-binding protein [Bryobacteraceae bacterium]